MANLSASDLAKLFIILGDQAKAFAQDSSRISKSRFVPKDLVTQFNTLAETADEIAGVKITKFDAMPQYIDEFIIRANIAAEMAKVHGDPGTKGTVPNAARQTSSDANGMRTEKPRVFIGCSVEGLRYARIIQLQLSPGARTTIWNQGVFGLSRGTLESLVAERKNYDYAILVLTPDDTRIKRDQEGPVPRDNVIFELGLFMGALGRDRVFMVVQKGAELPTDLAGIAPAIFDPEDDINIISVLGPVATMLEIAMGLI